MSLCSYNREPLSRGTPGFSGADLKNLLNEVALACFRRSTLGRLAPKLVR
jgi:ATP-dependent Zn protease